MRLKSFLLIVLITIVTNNTAHAMDEETGNSDDLKKKIFDFVNRHKTKFIFSSRQIYPNILNKGRLEKNLEDENNPCLLYLYDESLDDIIDELKDEGVELDCQLFAQIAHLIKHNRSKDKFFFLLKGYCSAQIINIFHFGELKDPEFAYIAPEDEDSGKFLEKTTIHAKGQWVIKNGEKWMGFGADSTILSQNEHDWFETIKESIQEQCKNVSEKNIRLTAECGIVDMYRMSGKLDKWRLYK